MRSVPLPFLSKITLLWTRAREPGPVSPVKVDSPLPFPWTQRGEIYKRCKNRHSSSICTRFEHHFHALKPHLHRRSFSDTLPENQRHLIALKRHPCGTYKSSASQAGQQSSGQLSSGTGMPFSVKMFSNCRIRSRCRWSSFSAA